MGLNHEKDRGRKSRDNTLPVSHFKYYLRLSLCGLMLQPARWAAWWPSPHSYPTPRNVEEASSPDCSSRICSMHKSMLLKSVCVCLLRKEKGLLWQQILIQFFIQLLILVVWKCLPSCFITYVQLILAFLKIQCRQFWLTLVGSWSGEKGPDQIWIGRK